MPDMSRGVMSVVRSRVLPSVAIVAIVLGVSVGVAYGGGEQARDPAAQRAAVQSKAPDLPNLVRAFQRDQNASDRIPGDPVADLEASGTLQDGEDPTLARRLAVSKDPVWVWPANGRACYAFAGAGGCVPTAELRKRGVLISTAFQSSDAAVVLFGLVAPGVRDLKVALTDGSVLTPKVVDDAFTLTTTSDPLRATWTSPDGAAGTQEPLVVRSSG